MYSIDYTGQSKSENFVSNIVEHAIYRYNFHFTGYTVLKG